jgi:hypothetical protein
VEAVEVQLLIVLRWCAREKQGDLVVEDLEKLLLTPEEVRHLLVKDLQVELVLALFKVLVVEVHLKEEIKISQQQVLSAMGEMELQVL